MGTHELRELKPSVSDDPYDSDYSRIGKFSTWNSGISETRNLLDVSFGMASAKPMPCRRRCSRVGIPGVKEIVRGYARRFEAPKLDTYRVC